MWPVEEIPDEHYLYLRVHKSFLKFGLEIPLGVFRDQGGGMSTDWDRYSTPQETQARAKSSPPDDNGVLKINVGGVRMIEGLSVQHTPIEDNRSHTEVFGDKKTNPKVRLMLKRLAEWVIPIKA